LRSCREQSPEIPPTKHDAHRPRTSLAHRSTHQISRLCLRCDTHWHRHRLGNTSNVQEHANAVAEQPSVANHARGEHGAAPESSWDARSTMATRIQMDTRSPTRRDGHGTHGAHKLRTCGVPGPAHAATVRQGECTGIGASVAPRKFAITACGLPAHAASQDPARRGCCCVRGRGGNYREVRAATRGAISPLPAWRPRRVGPVLAGSTREKERRERRPRRALRWPRRTGTCSPCTPRRRPWARRSPSWRRCTPCRAPRARPPTCRSRSARRATPSPSCAWAAP